MDGQRIGCRSDLRKALALGHMFTSGERRTALGEAKFAGWRLMTAGITGGLRRKHRRPCRVICEAGEHPGLEFHILPVRRDRSNWKTMTQTPKGKPLTL